MAATPINASCISIGGRGVVIFCPSRSGKSALALRLIDEGAQLVGDDQIRVQAAAGTLFASPHDRIEGMIEARGLGILHMPCLRDIPVALAVRLVARDEIERLPPPLFF